MRVRRRALRIALGYAVVAGAWLAATEWLAAGLLPGSLADGVVQAVQGGVLVAATAALLYHLQRLVLSLAERVESRVDLLARRSPDLIFRYRLAPHRGYEYVSPAATSLTGYTPEELYRDPDLLVKLTHPDDREGLVRQLEDPESMRETEELRWVRRDGRTVWVELKHSLVQDADGRTVAVEGIVRDVTGRREGERERRVLAAALEATSDSVVITDLEGDIEYVNPAFSKISGWPREEVIGRNPKLLKSGRQDEAFYHRMWRTLTQGRTFRGRFVNRRADGDLYVQDATITPVRGLSSRVEHYVAVARDVTERDLLERRLQAAERAEAMGQVTGGISHDFRNVLSIVRTHVEMAQEAVAEGRHPAEELDQIARAADRGVDLVQKLLTLGRSDALDLRPLSLADVAKDLRASLRAVLPRAITLDLRLPSDDSLPVLGDRGSIEAVLVNLAANARDALPGGGAVSIELDRVAELGAEAADVVLGHRAAPPGGWARLRFRDDGEGMTEETLRRIFEPFFTTKPRDVGTGIGMSMVARLMRLQKGAMTISSRPGEGTSVCLYLPISREDPLARSQEEDVVRSYRGSGERILVVEDEEALLDVQVKALERLGYRPVAAKDGDEAVRYLEAHGEELDLVMTDLIMPGRTGKELYDELGTLGLQGLPFVFMSGYTLEDEGGALPPGAEKLFLGKPWTLDQLGRTVAEALAEDPPARSTG